MVDLVEEFVHAKEYTGDVWVADYTQQTSSMPAENRKGVCISDTEFTDISAFHLQNPKHVAMLGVNFEEYPHYFPGGIQNCECLFRAKEVVDGGFLLLCELKYCKAHNIQVNAEKAYDQLNSTWNHLASKGIFDSNHCKSFLNISVPDHSDKSPFSSFLYPQNERLDWLKKYRIVLLGENNLLVLDKGIIKVPVEDV